MEKEVNLRETLTFTEYEIAPILCEYALESGTYDDILNDAGEIIGTHSFQDFVIIQSETIYTDLEKGYEQLEVVVQRQSDLKYFKGNYDYSYNGNYYNNLNLIEVFPRQMTITIFN